jgi:uncharacterized protein YdaU (DUF1376 family)
LHYFQFNIGDYRKDTVHLSRLEHSIYRDLIDWYYLDEKPIPKKTQSVSRRLRLVSQEEQNALIAVLQDFFICSEDGWRHKRIDQEIQDYHDMCQTNRVNGGKGGRPKKNPVGFESQPTRNPNQEPITNNQEPIINTTRQKAISCPQGVSEDVWRDFCQHRRSVRATVTQTALDGIDREAKKAGWSLEAALQECVVRGWRGFKAEWVKDKQSDKVLSFAERDDLAKRKRWEEMTGRKWPEPGDKVERLQIL